MRDNRELYVTMKSINRVIYDLVCYFMLLTYESQWLVWPETKIDADNYQLIVVFSTEEIFAVWH